MNISTSPINFENFRIISCENIRKFVYFRLNLTKFHEFSLDSWIFVTKVIIRQ
jgi:hypothetical protein